MIKTFSSYYLVYDQGLNNYFALTGYFTAITISLITFSVIIIIYNLFNKAYYYRFIAFILTNSLFLTFLIPFPKIRSRLFIFILMPIIISFIKILNDIGINKIISIIIIILPFILIKFY